jgi:hypothetical protein
MDGHTIEEVTVNVLCERLPNFCLVCGVIGHQEDGCDLPASLRRRRYNTGLGVQHTHVDDPRKWYLAESAGENRRPLRLNSPWRNIPRLRASTFLTPTQQAASVALVAEKVGKMTVQDNEKKGEIATPADMNISDNHTINLHDKNTTPVATTIATNNKSLMPDSSASPNKSCSDTAKSSESSNNKGLKQETPAKVHTEIGNNENAGQKKNWKRMPRLDTTAGAGTLNAQASSDGTVLGKCTERKEEKIKRNEAEMQITKKKSKGLAGKEDTPRTADGKEATSPGAAGQLIGASVSTCQEP